MKETAADDKARDAIKLRCSGPIRIYKHNDRGTKGMPDMSVAWNGFESWLEFKMLHGEQNIHQELDGLQLVELLKLERALRGHSWVIAYRKATKSQREVLDIYAPSFLIGGAAPAARENSNYDTMLRDLRAYGVARFEGFDHGAVAALIYQTHQPR